MTAREIFITGPTASGKSSLALAVAERLSGEIISTDSMQIYRGMDIGTAKPNESERARVRHHLIDIADIDKPYSAADFVRDAKAAAADIKGRGKIPIFCGGTGLYIDSYFRGDFPETTSADTEIRAALFAEAESEGGRERLYAELCAVDKDAAEKIHPNNIKRVVRALEIYRVSGMTKTEWDARRELADTSGALVVCLRFNDRELLGRRIDGRVDAMMSEGLLDEVRRLRGSGLFSAGGTAAAAIGYKELLAHLDGEMSERDAVDAIKLATRHYAKRQMTWFAAKDYIKFIDADECGAARGTDALLRDLTELYEN